MIVATITPQDTQRDQLFLRLPTLGAGERGLKLSLRSRLSPRAEHLLQRLVRACDRVHARAHGRLHLSCAEGKNRMKVRI